MEEHCKAATRSIRTRRILPMPMIINLLRSKIPLLLYCLSIFFFFSSSIFVLLAPRNSGGTTAAADISSIVFRCSSGATTEADSRLIQELGKGSGKFKIETNNINTEEVIMLSEVKRSRVPMILGGTRKILSALGSSPPRCTWKCGKCTPCKPVHVPVPPGTPVTAEYYPEAWRCKCGNRLYMP